MIPVLTEKRCRYCPDVVFDSTRHSLDHYCDVHPEGRSDLIKARAAMDGAYKRFMERKRKP